MVTHPCINQAHDCLTSVIKCKMFTPCYVSPTTSQTGSRPMGRPSGLVCFGCSCWNRQRGSMLPQDRVSILTWTKSVPLLLVLAGSLMTVDTSLHCWELMLSMIISFGCTSPTIPQSIAAMNRSLCAGVFSLFWLWQLVVLSLFS